MLFAQTGIFSALFGAQSLLIKWGMSLSATQWIIIPLGIWLTAELFWFFAQPVTKQRIKNYWLKSNNNEYILPANHNINIDTYITSGKTYYVMRVTNEEGKEYLSMKSANLKELQDKKNKMCMNR